MQPLSTDNVTLENWIMDIYAIDLASIIHEIKEFLLLGSEFHARN